jgi:hypothetical protein
MNQEPMNLTLFGLISTRVPGGKRHRVVLTVVGLGGIGWV